MLIPTGERISVVAKGSVLKPVHCGRCAADYGYAVSCSATGAEDNFLRLNGKGAEAKARQQAQRELAESLEQAVLPVPCPQCGFFQANMIRPARWRYARPLKWVGWGLVIAAAILMFPFWSCHRSDPNSELAARGFHLLQWVLGLGFGLVILRQVLARFYNPNNLPLQKRIQLGQQHALTAKELQDLQDQNRRGADKSA